MQMHTGVQFTPRPNRAELIEAIESGEFSVAELASEFGYTPASVARIRATLTNTEPFARNHSLAQYDRLVTMLRECKHTIHEIAAETTYSIPAVRTMAEALNVPAFLHRHAVDNLPYIPRPPFFSDAPLIEPKPYEEMAAAWRAGTLDNPITLYTQPFAAA